MPGRRGTTSRGSACASTLPPGSSRVEWLGRGPHECYSDRRAAPGVGRWPTAVDDWPVPYVHPQASGNRTGVRWLRFLDADGDVVLTIDELDDLDVTVVAAGPTRSSPTPPTSRTCRSATTPSCGSTPATAASARAPSGPT